MGFEDFFEDRHNRHKFNNKYHHDHDEHYDHSFFDDHHDYRKNEHNYTGYTHDPAGNFRLQLLEKLKNNPKFRMLVITALFIILILVVLLLILAFPLIMKIISYIGQNGLQGVLDTIWKGQK